MNKARKKSNTGFKIVFILTVINLFVFFGLIVLFGLFASKTNDADLNGGIVDVFKFHFSDIKGLFTFNFHKASNIVYFSLSGLLYFFIFIAILYLIVGILIIVKKKKLIVLPGIIASLIVVFVFIMMATGLPKYWAIINHRGSFDGNNSLLIQTFGILLFGAFYILTAYILYFYSIFLAFKNKQVPVSEPVPEVEKVEEKPEEKKEEPLLEEPQDEEEKEQPIAEDVNDDSPVMFEEIDPEDLPDLNKEKMTQNKAPNRLEESFNKDDLSSILKEALRDIVRDEIARNNAAFNRNNNNQNQQGNGPLIVQYFNTMPMENKVVSQSAPEPKAEEKKPDSNPEPKPQPQPEPAKEKTKPIAAPVVVETAEEKKPIIRIPFVERMLTADKEMQDNYNELKNEILSYGVNSRVSNSGDTFRLHRKTYIKITIAGLSLKLYFALNPDDYKDSTLPIQNAGHKGIYEEIPLVFKVKSGLSMRRCKQLIQDVFDKNGLEQGEIGNINWVEDLKNSSDSEDDD